LLGSPCVLVRATQAKDSISFLMSLYYRHDEWIVGFRQARTGSIGYLFRRMSWQATVQLIGKAHSPRRSPAPWRIPATASAEDAIAPYPVAGFGAMTVPARRSTFPVPAIAPPRIFPIPFKILRFFG